MTCFQPAAEALRAQDCRLTPQRMMVLETLYHHPGHATAEEVWARVRQHHPYIDLSTVYRSLQFLKSNGLVSEIHPANGPAQYEAAQSHPHAHAVCRVCGATQEIPVDWLTSLIEALRQEQGFIADVDVDVVGLCAACARGREELARSNPA